MRTIKNNWKVALIVAVGLETDFAMWIFWIIWMVLIGVCVYSFYYIDNKWLE